MVASKNKNNLFIRTKTNKNRKTFVTNEFVFVLSQFFASYYVVYTYIFF